MAKVKPGSLRARLRKQSGLRLGRKRSVVGRLRRVKRAKFKSSVFLRNKALNRPSFRRRR